MREYIGKKVVVLCVNVMEAFTKEARIVKEVRERRELKEEEDNEAGGQTKNITVNTVT